MEKIADVKVFNDTFIEMVKAGETTKAAASASKFTRNKLRENSFAERVVPPQNIANDELDKSEDTELLVKWNDREPDQSPAVTVPLGIVPDGMQFKGSRFPNYFARIMSPMAMKDIDLLRSYDYDIRGILLENMTKDIATEIDTRFLAKVNASIGTANTANSLNNWHEDAYPGDASWNDYAIQNVDLSATNANPLTSTVAVPISRDSLVDAMTFIQRLRVPFGPMQPDGGESKGCILMNNITAAEILKFNRTEVGGDLSQQHFVEGKLSKTILGMEMITTIKRELVPDYVVYYFSSPEFFGRYLRLQPLTVFMEQKSFYLSFFEYMNISISIGNVRGAVKVKFDAPTYS